MPPTNQTPPGVRLITDGGTDIFEYPTKAAGVVTRDTDGGEQALIRVPISSTRSDRENDEFDKTALEDMASQIKDDQPMVFDNHGLAGSWMDAIPYDSRETIGSQVDAEVETDDDGEHTLYAFVNPDGTHPEGERMLKQVQEEGQPIKFSVGFKVHNYDEKTDDAGNEIGRIFTAADLMETSRVGIPANPDASTPVEMSAKDATGSLPGYQNHPLFKMMQAMQGERAPENGDSVAKNATPDGGETPEEPDYSEKEYTVEVDTEELQKELASLREEVQTLKEESTKEDDDDACSVDDDCPDGEVCLEGECVPEDEVEDSTTPEEQDAIEELRSEIQELRESGLERGESKTGGTDMETKETPEDETAAVSDDDGEQTNKNEAETGSGHRTTSDIINN